MTLHRDQVTLPLDFSGAPRLEITVERCAVVLVPAAAGAQPAVEITGRRINEGQLRVWRDGPVLRLKDHGDLGPGATLTCRLPSRTEVSVHSETGGIEVQHLVGRLRLSSEVGRITLQDVSGTIDLSTEAGHIDGDGIGGVINVRCEAGAVRLRITQLSPGDHNVETEAGSIRVELTPNLPVRILASAELGHVSVDYPQHDRPTATLHISTEVGSVNVRTGAALRASAGNSPDAQPNATGSDAAPTSTDHAADVRRILQMVQDGVLTATEANELLQALASG